MFRFGFVFLVAATALAARANGIDATQTTEGAPGPALQPGLDAATSTRPPQVAPEQRESVRARHFDVQNDFQAGPSSLFLNRMAVTGEVLPDSVQASVFYRFATDEASVGHHLFGLGVQSPRCEHHCGLRWFALAGFSPDRGAPFIVDNRKDTLYWSALQIAAGASLERGSFVFGLDAQLESLALDYTRGKSSEAALTDTLTPIRLRAMVETPRHPGFGFKATLAKYAYAGVDPQVMSYVPVRGALIEDDLPGLAGAALSYTARVDGRWESRTGFEVEAGYSLLRYTSTIWNWAHIGSFAARQKVGRFRVGLGFAGEVERDSTGYGYASWFGTATVGASF